MIRSGIPRCAILGLLMMSGGAQAVDLPEGLMLNLDFRRIEQGLIPNKTLYPLYVPLGGLATEFRDQRTLLSFQQGQSLVIPHSSLLDPNGGEWVVSVRVFALTDGIVMSQGDEENGYAIYIQDGTINVAILSGHSLINLVEPPENGTTHCLNEWVTIDVRIKPDLAILSLNRARVNLLPLSAPLNGKNHRIRVGEHQTLPAALKYKKGVAPTGFSGSISSLKLLRQ